MQFADYYSIQRFGFSFTLYLCGIFLEALIRKVQVTIKIPLWERLPAAKLNDRGWKPLPQAMQLVLSR